VKAATLPDANVASVAKELKIGEPLLYGWIRKAKKGNGNRRAKSPPRASNGHGGLVAQLREQETKLTRQLAAIRETISLFT
jgi:transposase-like protein